MSHMHIGSVGIFEGPAPPHDTVLAAIAAKLHLVPRYRQRVRFSPLALARPVWVDDVHFHLEYHVRRTALPAPGGDEELRNLVGRVMAQKLDRSKPLWEMWLAEGLGDGRWALVNKLHHSMVDGVSGTDLLSVVFDAERRATPAESPPPWDPTPEPSTRRILGSAVAHAGEDPVRRRAQPVGNGARAVPGGRSDPRRDEPARAAASAGGDVAQRADRAAPTLGVGPRAPGRRQGDPDRARRHRQRRRSCRDRARLPRSAPTARRARGAPRRAHDGARVGAHAGRARHLQQQGLRDVRRPPRERRRPGRTPRDGPHPDAGPQGEPPGRGGFHAGVAGRLRARNAPGAGRPSGDAHAAALGEHRDHERPRSAARDLLRRPPDARLLPVRAARGSPAHRRSDRLLRRRAELRRHRRLRDRPGHRGAVPRDRGRNSGVAPAYGHVASVGATPRILALPPEPRRGAIGASQPSSCCGSPARCAG